MRCSWPLTCRGRSSVLSAGLNTILESHLFVIEVDMVWFHGVERRSEVRSLCGWQRGVLGGALSVARRSALSSNCISKTTRPSCTRVSGGPVVSYAVVIVNA